MGLERSRFSSSVVSFTAMGVGGGLEDIEDTAMKVNMCIH